METLLFLDCEFTGLTKDTDLISLCLYQDEDSFFYAEFNDYDVQKISPWHEQHVLNRLYYHSNTEIMSSAGNVIKMKGSRDKITSELTKWLSLFSSIQIWGDVPAYDWVLFCDLFGGALAIPKQIHYICGDIATLLIRSGIDKDISRIEFVKDSLKQTNHEQHNAFFDAYLTRLCYQKLTANVSDQTNV